MPQDARRRQASLQKKAAKRKAHHRALRASAPASPARQSMRQAAEWTLHECLVSSDWNTPGQIVQLLVARRSPEDEIAAAVFLVNLGCLGVKSASASIFETRTGYEQRLRARMTELQQLKAIDLDLAAKILREGLAYADELGFKPDPDYASAAILLQGADPDAAETPVPLGRNGKPFFVAGPYDNVPQIVARLTRAVGAGNFEFTAPIA